LAEVFDNSGLVLSQKSDTCVKKQPSQQNNEVKKAERAAKSARKKLSEEEKQAREAERAAKKAKKAEEAAKRKAESKALTKEHNDLVKAARRALKESGGDVNKLHALNKAIAARKELQQQRREEKERAALAKAIAKKEREDAKKARKAFLAAKRANKETKKAAADAKKTNKEVYVKELTNLCSLHGTSHEMSKGVCVLNPKTQKNLEELCEKHGKRAHKRGALKCVRKPTKPTKKDN